MVEIIWTRIALEDLRTIFLYISADSVYYATRFINKLITRVDVLQQFPYSGRIIPEKGDQLIRELIEGNYRIFYYIESEKKVFILRVHHSSKNIDYL